MICPQTTWAGLWDIEVPIIGFMRTLYTNVCQRAPKANEATLRRVRATKVAMLTFSAPAQEHMKYLQHGF